MLPAGTRVQRLTDSWAESRVVVMAVMRPPGTFPTAVAETIIRVPMQILPRVGKPEIIVRRSLLPRAYYDNSCYFVRTFNYLHLNPGPPLPSPYEIDAYFF